MNITSEQMPTESHTQSISSERLKRGLVGGALTEAIAGIGAVTLTIIGLSGVAPMTMGAIAVIVVGVGLLSEAGTLVAEYPAIISRTRKRFRDKIEFSAGFGAEGLAGTVAIVLGILVLLGAEPLVLLPSAAIVLGAGLVLTSAAISFISSLNLNFLLDGHEDSHEEHIAHVALGTAMGVQVVLGFAVVVLGILALVGFIPSSLTLVAILVASVAALMDGIAVSGRVISASTD
ncbi:hypothetical protein Noc_0266 [Nitrosococcus oceani ATCC 19707]|uniref:Transmembrane protein n=2 Tax=Nitrosococcus oceani TaxID=1229 RepID=Q3JEF0_NITOC|nr:hypothetical protein [Nitrosococcus oceani]ABA56796.1 hypothetical protein Noc_0266 [Nitrosococcus oceani ATCC 19707]EDZ65464.1 hypothetical protein NOC27_2144 [Nitrosococcus oceani AFC27]KFI20750.1 hypothetical protein IB75_01365 [Nitrosococcus oceani C-27]GEM20553.1 hypothetical protein NONS58_19720 [Nitrosococcus oceani]